MEYNAATKKKVILPFAATMNQDEPGGNYAQ